MGRIDSPLFVLPFLFIIIASATTTRLPELSPEAEADLVVDLPGTPGPVSSRIFSGYLKVQAQEPVSLFYAFAESQSRNPEADPFVLWLNGGPGCSSLNGFLAELGPYWPTADGTLVENPWAWNRIANVLFLEAPAFVGFSTSSDNTNLHKPGDALTAVNNRLAILAFLDRFPHLKKRDMFITGESWSGHYCSQLALAVVEGNREEPETAIRLKGLLVGNPSLGHVNNERANLRYWNAWGALDDQTYEILTTRCMPSSYDPFHPNVTRECKALRESAEDQIGYETGVDVYNILAPVCPFGQEAALRSLHQRTAAYLTGKSEPATVQPTTTKVTSLRRLTSSVAASNTLQSTLRRTANAGTSAAALHASTATPVTAGRVLPYQDDPCVRSGLYLATYLNQKSVQKAMNVDDGGRRKLPVDWVMCNDELNANWDSVSRLQSMTPVYQALIDAGVPLTIYSGDIDSVCPFTGVLEMASEMGLLLVDPRVRRRPWYTSDGEPRARDTGGWVAEWQGLTHATVRGAGHMVPYDQPEKAFYILQQTLAGDSL